VFPIAQYLNHLDLAAHRGASGMAKFIFFQWH